MKKLFFTFCFASILFGVSGTEAGVRSIVSPADFRSERPRAAQATRPADPVFYDEEELFEYFEERAKHVVITEIPPEELEQNVVVSIVPDEEFVKDKEKSFFQQVYEKAIERVSGTKPQEEHQDIIWEAPVETVQQQQAKWTQQPAYQTVGVELPSGRKVLVPALEHIPYLMSDITLLPNGMAEVREKVIVVANGEKLLNGLSKTLQKYSISREGKKQPLDVNLISVKIDGQDIAYKIEEVGNLLVLAPKQKYELQPGVYTFDFQYVVDRQLIGYENFEEFAWNITGNNWNLIIARAGAVVTFPGNKPDLGRAVGIVGNGSVDATSTRVLRIDNSTLGFTSGRPVFVGEYMSFIISLSKDAFIAPDIDKKIYWAIDDYGNIILSLLGLIAIVGAYFVSWVFISENKSNPKYALQKNGAVARYLLKGKFDKISFGAFILDLFRKNIIDIRKEQGKISLIKTSDNLGSLNKHEKNALKDMFLGKESSLEISKANALKIRRAYREIEKDTKTRIKRFLLKINMGYIAFSVVMLLLAQMGIALLEYSPVYSMSVMLACDLVVAGAMWMLLRDSRKPVLKYVFKTLALILIVAAGMVLSVIMSKISAVFIIITIYAIFAYTNMFSNRNGLIKTNIKEIQNMREHIIKNVETISSQRMFVTQQPNIYALELAEYFTDKVGDKEFYKIDLVDEISRIV